MKAESYVERWAREQAEKKKDGDKIEQNSRSEGQAEKKTKRRSK